MSNLSKRELLIQKISEALPKDIYECDYTYWTTHENELKIAVTHLLKNRPKEDANPLEPVETIRVFTDSNFCINDSFLISEKPPIQIGWIGEKFQREFLSNTQNKNYETGITTLKIYDLTQKVTDKTIVEQLGGEEKAETSLSQMWSLLKAQGMGQDGPLLINGNSNIFYIKGQNNVLWSISCFWHESIGPWRIEASLFSNLSVWKPNRRVIAK